MKVMRHQYQGGVIGHVVLNADSPALKLAGDLNGGYSDRHTARRWHGAKAAAPAQRWQLIDD